MVSRTCLLIEDSQTQAHVISQMIKDCGWSSLTAFTLKSGLQTLRDQPVDLVITDLLLPDCDDGGTVGRIGEQSPDVIIAAISAGGGKSSAMGLLSRARSEGAQFLLRKPFEVERLRGMLDEVSSRFAGEPRKPHVLVIDDSRTVRAICHKVLGAAGWRVSLADSIDTALSTLDIMDLDALVIDLCMPGTGGAEALPRLRGRLPGVGIVAMSGGGNLSADAALRETLNNGADVALAKPFGAEDLVSATRKAMVLASAALLAAVRSAA